MPRVSMNLKDCALYFVFLLFNDCLSDIIKNKFSLFSLTLFIYIFTMALYKSPFCLCVYTKMLFTAIYSDQDRLPVLDHRAALYSTHPWVPPKTGVLYGVLLYHIYIQKNISIHNGKILILHQLTHL